MMRVAAVTSASAQSLVAAPSTRKDFGVVRISVGCGQQDRLFGGVCVAREAVRQEALFAVSPEVTVERRYTLVGACANERFPTALARLFEQAGQHVFEGCPFEVIEEDFRHQLS
jgi:hypothetical protein